MEELCGRRRHLRTSASSRARKSAYAALGVLACISAVGLWSERPSAAPSAAGRLAAPIDGRSEDDRGRFAFSDAINRQLDEAGGQGATGERREEVAPRPPATLDAVCGRDAAYPSRFLTPEFEVGVESSCTLYSSSSSATLDPRRTTLVLEGYDTYGRTGNHLRALLHAFQYARDREYQLAIMYNSWAMGTILRFFFATGHGVDGDGGADGDDRGRMREIERALCVKVIYSAEDVRGTPVALKSVADLFHYRTKAPDDERVAYQLHLLRRMYSKINEDASPGDTNQVGDQVRDMCSGIRSVFGTDADGVRSANYTVVHIRYLEGRPGLKLLAWRSGITGCDPTAALEMSPEYVKSILRPIGMMENPVVVIHDDQNSHALGRLRSDPEIGHLVRPVESWESWLGGDIALGVMANAFIGNPVSTFSGFIAKSRVALGFGNTYLDRARDEDTGEWYSPCGEDCIFLERSNSTKAHDYRPERGHRSDFLGARVIPLPVSRTTIRQWRKEREAREATKELRGLASGGPEGRKVYRGLHPDEVEWVRRYGGKRLVPGSYRSLEGVQRQDESAPS